MLIDKKDTDRVVLEMAEEAEKKLLGQLTDDIETVLKGIKLINKTGDVRTYMEGEAETIARVLAPWVLKTVQGFMATTIEMMQEKPGKDGLVSATIYRPEVKE